MGIPPLLHVAWERKLSLTAVALLGLKKQNREEMATVHIKNSGVCRIWSWGGGLFLEQQGGPSTFFSGRSRGQRKKCLVPPVVFLWPLRGQRKKCLVPPVVFSTPFRPHGGGCSPCSPPLNTLVHQNDREQRRTNVGHFLLSGKSAPI